MNFFRKKDDANYKYSAACAGTGCLGIVIIVPLAMIFVNGQVAPGLVFLAIPGYLIFKVLKNQTK